MSKEKKIVINVKMFALKRKTTITAICDTTKVSRVSIFQWGNEAPESVRFIFGMVKQNPKMDVLKTLKGMNKKSHVLQFIYDVMSKYDAKFDEIVVEI